MMCGMNVNTECHMGYIYLLYICRGERCICVTFHIVKQALLLFCKTLFVLMLFCEGRESKQEKNVKNFNNKRCYKNAIDHKVILKNL